jgi:hypothetical protein
MIKECEASSSTLDVIEVLLREVGVGLGRQKQVIELREMPPFNVVFKVFVK